MADYVKKPDSAPYADEKWLDWMARAWDDYREDEVAKELVDLNRPSLIALLCLRFMQGYEPPTARREIEKLARKIGENEHCCRM